MTTAQFGIRLDEKEKREFETNAKAIGLTAASAVKMMIYQFNHDKGFNYPINRKNELDNYELPKDVERAMIITKAEEFRIIKDTSVKVDDLNTWKKRWIDK